MAQATDPISLLDNLGNLVTDGFKKTIDQNASMNRAAIVSEDDKDCKTTGVTDESVIKSAKWKAILAGAILAYNTMNSLRMAKLQRDLGQKYLELSEEHRKYYNERYKPLEISLTQEALALPKYVRDKEQLNTGQMLTLVRGRNAGKIDKAISCTGRYCTGQRAAIMTDQLLEQALTESMVAGLGFRYTDREEITHNNLRWEKREQVMRIGRDIPTEAVSYASLAAGTFGSLGKQAGMAASGAIDFLAYGRGNTQYPEQKGPMTVSGYYYEPTKLDLPKPKPTENYKKPKEPETTIKLSG